LITLQSGAYSVQLHDYEFPEQSFDLKIKVMKSYSGALRTLKQTPAVKFWRYTITILSRENYNDLAALVKARHGRTMIFTDSDGATHTVRLVNNPVDFTYQDRARNMTELVLEEV
jgi:hypothetical protein